MGGSGSWCLEKWCRRLVSKSLSNVSSHPLFVRKTNFPDASGNFILYVFPVARQNKPRVLINVSLFTSSFVLLLLLRYPSTLLIPSSLTLGLSSSPSISPIPSSLSTWSPSTSMSWSPSSLSYSSELPSSTSTWSPSASLWHCRLHHHDCHAHCSHECRQCVHHHNYHLYHHQCRSCASGFRKKKIWGGGTSDINVADFHVLDF